MAEVPVLIDVQATLDDFLRTDLINAECQAVFAEIALRGAQILEEQLPGRLTDQIPGLTEVSQLRRRRADGIAVRLGVDTPQKRFEIVDTRLDVVNMLSDLQASEVIWDEREAHIDLYAITTEEAAAQLDIARRNGVSVQPLTEAQIHAEVLMNKAKIRAHVEWLTDHLDGPVLEDSLMNPQRQEAVERLRKFIAGTADVVVERAAADVTAQQEVDGG